MSQGKDEEIYPNSPLADVACELRFPGDLQVECERHLFWERIRGEYPDILVPHAQPGQPPAMQHYRFRNSANTRAVMVALHSLAVSETKYSGHKEFIGEFSRLVAIFRECFPRVRKLNRIGWRYVNIIPFRREEGLVPVRRFFKAQIEMPFPLMGVVRSIDARFDVRVSSGAATIHLATVARKEQADLDAILLDIDMGSERQDLDIAESVSHAKELHKHGRSMFEQMITDEYRQYLRGETL